jgi:TRAP-type mannitol/chloroaromatic compound transport system permease small subunit
MRLLTAVDRVVGALVVTSNILGSLLIFVMTFAVVADVTGRYLFNAPIHGTAEMITLAVVAVLYLQLSYTLRSGRMTRSDAFFARFIAKRPRLGSAVGFLFHLAGVGLAAAIMLGNWPKLLAAWQENFYVGVIGVFTFPEWPLLLIIFVGVGLTGLQFVLLAIGNLLTIGGAAPAPLGGLR